MTQNELTRAEMARMYAEVFTVGNGPHVLNHLDALFRARVTYVPGGIEAQRETERRAAQKDVVDYILSMIDIAQNGGRDAAEVDVSSDG